MLRTNDKRTKPPPPPVPKQNLNSGFDVHHLDGGAAIGPSSTRPLQQRRAVDLDGSGCPRGCLQPSRRSGRLIDTVNCCQLFRFCVVPRRRRPRSA